MPGKPSFSEAWRDADGGDPLSSSQVDPDWETIERELDGHQLTVSEFEKLGSALKAVLGWMVPARCSSATVQNVILRRLVIMAWCLSPSYFADSPSLRRLAEDLGISTTIASRHAASFRRRFGIQNRSQQHGWNFRSQKGGANARK